MEVTLTSSSSSSVVNKYHQCSSSIGNFPLELVLEIISRLDLELITRLKLLSKSFRKMIEDSSILEKLIAMEEPGVLIVSHDNVTGSTTFLHARDEHNVKPIYRAPFLSKHPGEYLVECYFKGLVCFCKRDDVEEQVIICNPLTREHVTLPGIPESESLSMYALGCGRLSKEYKVVRVHNMTLDQPQVFTLGKSSSWRHISSCPPYLCFRKTVFANGAIHWKIPPFYNAVCDERILSFDVDKEEFYFTKHPKAFKDPFKNGMIEMIQYGESLAFADFTFKPHINIWVHHDNVDKQWVKQCVIKFEMPKHPKEIHSMSDFYVIGLWQQDEILISPNTECFRLSYDLPSWNRHCFYSYNERTKCVREVTDMIQISPSTTIKRVCGYSRSLMSLKPYGYVEKQNCKSKKSTRASSSRRRGTKRMLRAGPVSSALRSDVVDLNVFTRRAKKRVKVR